MYMTGKNWLSCGAAVALAATLAIAPVPAVAFADGASAVSEQNAGVDWAKLANGTYTVSVSAKQTPAATSDSVMNSALTKTADLTVKDGAYTLRLQIGSVFGGYLSAVDQFDSFTKGAEPTGGPKRVWTSPDSQNGSAADFSIVLSEQTKKTGLVALRFTSPKMMGYAPSAAIQIDTSSVKVVKLDQPTPPVKPGGGSEGDNPGGGSGTTPGGGTHPGGSSDQPSDPAQIPGDKTAAVKFISSSSGKDVTSHMAGMVGTTAGYTAKPDATFDVFLVVAKKAAALVTGATYGDAGKAAEVSEAADGSKVYKFNVASVTKPFRVTWKVTAGPHSEVVTDVVLDVQEAPKPEPGPKPDPTPKPAPIDPKPAPVPEEQLKQAQGMQVGHSYRIPINFTKTGTGIASMAGQYFGDNAVVIPRADGTLEVRFSTNRPDYITSLTYGGVAASVVSESASSREYSIVIPRSDKDTTVSLLMTISAINNMTVSADMHLYLSDAKDLGAGSNFHATSGKTGTAPSNSAVTGTPQTGDAHASAGSGVVTAVSALAAAGAAALTRRRRA